VGGYRTTAEWARAAHNGATLYSTARKIPSQASIGGRWVDLSMAAGNPPPNYYASAPLVAATLESFRGVYHGDSKTPARKHLAEMTLQTPSSALLGQYMLLDYLLYYPFVDLDDADEQIMDNTISLPRYTDGSGVMVMAVAVAPTTAGGAFTFDYIDDQGVARTTPTIYTDLSSVSIASIATCGVSVSAQGPFVLLHSASTGVRRITAFRNLAASGGLVSLVLVKPVAKAVVREANSPSEAVFGGPGVRPPRIMDGAYLNLIVNCAASVAAASVTVDLLTTWG
jgi:hypothetical protein